MISSKLRPVEAGYAIRRRMVFLGSMMNTVRICSEDISLCATSYHDCTHGERQTLRVTIRGILLVKHVIEGRDLTVCIGNLGNVNL